MDLSNGEGIGIALFVQGCPFEPHCKGCFNPETWDFSGGKEWTDETKEKFMELANRPYIKRISILGGEPLAEENLDGVLELANEIRLSFPQKSIWLYTGYKWEEIWNNDDEYYECNVHPKDKQRYILQLCNVLIDGKYMDSQRDITFPWRGSTNQRLIDVQKSLQQGEVVLWQI